MFLRKKKNKSGIISVQVIDKSAGKYKVVKTIGSSINEQEVEKLLYQGHQWSKNHLAQNEIDFQNEKQLFCAFIAGIKQITVAGTELLLGKIFDEIGFNKKHLKPVAKQLMK